MYHKVRNLFILAFFLFGCSSEKQTPIPVPSLPPYIAPTTIVITISTPISIQLNERVLPNQWDGGLFSEMPCIAPCFANITPGVTTEEETIAIIHQDPLHFQNCRIEDLSNQYSFRDKNLYCYGLGMNISRKTNIITSINFGPEEKITLLQLIGKYGEPTSIDVSPDGTPEDPATYMIVFFDNNKLRVDLGPQEGTSYTIDPEEYLYSFTYYIGTNSGMDTYTQPWKGFETYECLGSC